MNDQVQYVLYNGNKYRVLADNGIYLTICNGEYSSFGECLITVKKEYVRFL